MLCCAVLCCAVPRCSALRCGAPCLFVLCRAVSCRVVSCHGVAGCAVLCRAALCRSVLCRVVVCLVALRCKAVRCTAVCRAASCCAVLCSAVVCGGSIVPLVRRGVATALVRLVALLCGTRAEVMWLAGGRGAWLGVVRLVFFCVAGVWVCRSAWRVRRVSAGLPSLGACALVRCPLGVPVPRGVPGSVGWGCVVPSAL